MAPIVLAVKPAAIRDWSSYFRVKLTDDYNGRQWDQIDGKWQPWMEAMTNGRWTYELGHLTLLDKDLKTPGPSLDRVHWNFRIICQQNELTGPGTSIGRAQRLTWVMGVVPKHVTDNHGPDTFLDPMYFHSPNRREWNLSATKFKIRLLSARPGSVGVGIAIDHLIFEIQDDAGTARAVYEYTGKGLEVGASNWGSTSTEPQPFQTFSTVNPMKVTDFAGDASFGNVAGDSFIRMSGSGVVSKGGTRPGDVKIPVSGKGGTTLFRSTDGVLKLQGVSKVPITAP